MSPCVIQSSPSKAKSLGIFRKVFPKGSETFISEPAEKMSRYSPTFITCNLLESLDKYPAISIGRGSRLGIRQSLYMMTRSPKFFKDQDALSQLDIIHSHFGPDGIYAMELAKSLNIPFLVTFHGWDITVDRSAPWKLKSPLYYQLLWHEAELQQKASAFIAVSKFIKSQLIKKGYPRKKIIQHYIGIDTNKFNPTNQTKGARYILCVGRHTEKKGIETLLKAFSQISRKYPDVSLIQVGTGPLKIKLKKIASDLDIDHQVKFLGIQPYTQVQSLMRQAEIFALPSQTARNGDSEGLPFVILEAMACAVPVVSTWHSGIPEAITHGETGFLVSEKDDMALAQQLDYLLSHPSQAKAMGYQGREVVCQNFNIHKQTAMLENIYDKVLAMNGSIE